MRIYISQQEWNTAGTCLAEITSVLKLHGFETMETLPPTYLGLVKQIQEAGGHLESDGTVVTVCMDGDIEVTLPSEQAILGMSMMVRMANIWIPVASRIVPIVKELAGLIKTFIKLHVPSLKMAVLASKEVSRDFQNQIKELKQD